MTRVNHGQNDRGAILITILLIVAVMSAVAVAIIDDIRFGVRRASGAQAADQARWYALGAEVLAETLLKQSLQLDGERTTLAQPWAQSQQPVPLPGGFIDATLTDAGNCLNVNNLVQFNESGALEENPEAETLTRRLLVALNIPEATSESVIAAITDWLDSDSRISPGGAEDFDYLVAVPPYRTANGPIADIATLRAVSKVTPDLFGELKPYLCALPTLEFSPVNLNTLDGPVGAAIMAALIGDEISPEEALTVLSARPPAGFEDLDTFWTLPTFSDKTISDEAKGRFALKTQYFALDARVVYQNTSLFMSSLMAVNENNQIQHVTRQFGDEG